MPLAGKQLMPRDVAFEAHKYWRNFELTKAVATSLAESQAYIGAYHDNTDDSGNVTSRDCGVYQINIPASEIGTDAEFTLRTESTDSAVYEPVFVANVKRAFELYSSPWENGRDRLWQPWVAYTEGWAMFPEWWIWKQDANGNPTGPWVPTGRYLHRAIAGQMNLHIVYYKDWTASEALVHADTYCERWGIKNTLYVNKNGILVWNVPEKPASPPADGVGPRPLPNDGI